MSDEKILCVGGPMARRFSPDYGLNMYHPVSKSVQAIPDRTSVPTNGGRFERHCYKLEVDEFGYKRYVYEGIIG